MNRNLTPPILSKIRLLVGNTNSSPPKTDKNELAEDHIQP